MGLCSIDNTHAVFEKKSDIRWAPILGCGLKQLTVLQLAVTFRTDFGS